RGRVLERRVDLCAALEVDRPVHVLAADRLVDEQRGDRGGHEQDRDDDPDLELRDEGEVVSRRQQVAELLVGGQGVARLRSRWSPAGPSSWTRTSRRRCE